MADRSPVDTAEMRRLQSEAASHRGWIDTAGAFTVSAHAALRLVNALPALLDEIDSLRAKLAESEAACAVLVKAAGNLLREPDFIDYQNRADEVLASLPASVRAHMDEDAALRDCAEALRTFDEHVPEWPRFIARRKVALAHLDAVRAKGGG